MIVYCCICVVYVMLAEYYEFSGLLLAMKLQDLTDSGQYIVIGVVSNTDVSSDPQKYLSHGKVCLSSSSEP